MEKGRPATGLKLRGVKQAAAEAAWEGAGVNFQGAKGIAPGARAGAERAGAGWPGPHGTEVI